MAVQTPTSPGSIEPVAPWPPRPIEAPRSPPGPIDAPRTPRSIETPIIRTPETAPRPTYQAHLLYLRGAGGSQLTIERRHGRSLSSTEVTMPASSTPDIAERSFFRALIPILPCSRASSKTQAPMRAINHVNL